MPSRAPTLAPRSPSNRALAANPASSPRRAPAVSRELSCRAPTTSPRSSPYRAPTWCRSPTCRKSS
eukprot:1733937-Alexandrium_andersonii.AAC.1